MGGCATSKFSCLYCIGDYDQYGVYETGAANDTPSCWPCAATALYSHMPSINQRKTLNMDAQYLRASMKGLGTKDSNLGRIIAQRPKRYLQALKETFVREWGDDMTLEQWIKDDTSGDWETVLLMSVRDPDERDAELIHDTLEGIGTADDELRELMTTRSNRAMMKIRDKYMETYKTTLKQDIKDDTSFNYRNTLVALVSRADYLAAQLHDALKGAGTDDIRLIRILCSAPRSNAKYRRLLDEYEDHFNIGWYDDFEYEFWQPDLQDIKAAYQRLYNRSLVQDVAQDTTGNYRRTLLTLLQPPEETTADALNMSMEGKGTDDELLIEVMISRSNRDLQEASQVYQRKFHRELSQAISADTSGDYEKILLDLLKPRAENIAWHVHDSMEGLGTDDSRLMSLLTGKSRRELKRIALAFSALEDRKGEPLEEAIRSETSFWYKRYLVYLVRQAMDDLVWVPESQLKRIRDI